MNKYNYLNHIKSKPYHYEYSKMEGIKLLKKYENNREYYKTIIQKNIIDPAIEFNQVFKFYNYHYKKISYYFDKKTETILENIIIDKKYSKLPIWFNEIIRKFEVSKRIRNFYNLDFKKIKNTKNSSIHAYICIYYIISKSNFYNNELKKYNLLLKLGDLIFGSYDLVKSDFQKKLILSALNEELKIYYKLKKLI